LQELRIRLFLQPFKSSGIEPFPQDAVRSMVNTFKLLGIKMVAIGVGPNTPIATIIASNLKYLGYENTLAVSRLNDIPNKVLNVLRRN